MDTSMITNICKALSSPIRLEILQQLINGEKCACHLLDCFEITQPTLSHHMRVLCDCGLIQDRKAGKWHYYALERETLHQFGDFFAHMGTLNREAGSLCDCCGNGGHEDE